MVSRAERVQDAPRSAAQLQSLGGANILADDARRQGEVADAELAWRIAVCGGWRVPVQVSC